MKIAIIGSRGLRIKNLQNYLPENVDEIVSGGAKGIDSCVREYAIAQNIPFTEFFPEYNMFGKAAPIRRNMQIIDYADEVIVFWDGKSKGTKSVIDACGKKRKKILVIQMNQS